jgi:hypothetical protein
MNNALYTPENSLLNTQSKERMFSFEYQLNAKVTGFRNTNPLQLL